MSDEKIEQNQNRAKSAHDAQAISEERDADMTKALDKPSRVIAPPCCSHISIPKR